MPCGFPKPDDFKVQRFIGRGCYSIVYEVSKTTGSDNGSKYALKRFFLENDSSVKCVLRERRILERLALADFQSPFLPMLCYSIWCNFVSAFVLREGSGCDLYDLLCHVGCLSEAQARFYVAEIICGLEHLHSLNIVHLDVKPENVLFYRDGHIFVSDLDRSFDNSLNTKPTLDDFTGTPLFMAPEIARGEVIDVRADIWSLGVLTAEMTAGPIRPEARDTAEEFRRARMGTYNIRGLKRFSKPLQSFFSACLQQQHTQRPYLKGVKELRFLKCIDWTKANSRLLRPPYSTTDLHHRPSKERNIPVVSTDVRLLSGAFSPLKPLTFDSSHKPNDKVVKKTPVDVSLDNNLSSFEILPQSLKSAGYSSEKLKELFTSFNFVHPVLRASTEADLSNSLSKLDLVSTNRNNLPATTSDLFTENVKNIDEEHSFSPSCFRRSRTRGLSIGD